MVLINCFPLPSSMCVFGAEVLVIKNTVKANEFSFIKKPPNGTFTWKVDKFSTLDNKLYYSEVFSAGGCKWKLSVNPKGDSEEKDLSLSLYLNLAAAPRSKVYVEYKLLVKDQLNGIHRERKSSGWFVTGWGCRNFILLNDLYDVSKGFLVDDTLIVEAKILLMSVSQDLIC
ncbi:MATH domain and coiled-coil domain-containing protein At3g58410-like [Euphorbia lathyris]|uniref:MATH domain and coiled-coil domain-containing protein At3g58410-like n=1 Tax=Euphorbia lathyris TaxID=212925 RepID=UPI0033133FBE